MSSTCDDHQTVTSTSTTAVKVKAHPALRRAARPIGNPPGTCTTQGSRRSKSSSFLLDFFRQPDTGHFRRAVHFLATFSSLWFSVGARDFEVTMLGQ
jgi:hypothetical protein